MQILHQDDGSFIISEVEAPLQETLLAIPFAAETDTSEAAAERLYPKPATGQDGLEICEEWREYVEPDLRRLFEDANATVEADLDQIKTSDQLVIPRDHVDAWLNTLNQARVALAARFDISEGDIDKPIIELPENERDYALFQIHFYGFLQECLIRGINDDPRA